MKKKIVKIKGVTSGDAKEQLGTKVAKKAVLEALEKSMGVVTQALRVAGVGRTTFYQWMKHDKDFKEKVNAMPEIALDFAESRLFNAIQNGNIAGIIFYLKTKGKARGYIEKQEIEQTGDFNRPILIMSIDDKDESDSD
jgi:hypothetical protein